MNMKDYPEAIVDFNKVIELDPNNKAAKNQILIANARIREIREREKKIYAGMFQKFAQADAKVSNPGLVSSLFKRVLA